MYVSLEDLVPVKLGPHEAGAEREHPAPHYYIIYYIIVRYTITYYMLLYVVIYY